MKVVPQIVVFLVFLVIGWVAYDRHEAFRQLVDDIADVAGLYDKPRPAEPAKFIAAETVSHDAQSEGQPGQPPSMAAAREAEVSPPLEQTPSAELEPMAASEDAPASLAESPVPDAETTLQVEPSTEKTDTENAAVTKPAEKAEFMPVEEATVGQQVEQAAKQMPDQTPQKPESVMGQPETDAVETEVSAAEAAGITLEQQDLVPVTAEPPTTTGSVSTEDTMEGRETDQAVEQQIPDQQPTTVKPSSTRPEETRSRQTDMNQQAIMEARRQEALVGLSAARLDWQQGNHDTAINTYWQLLREYPNHPDFAGELGNIYFSQGQTEMAVNAYSEAFLRLLKNQDNERAMQVLQIVYNIDQEQAALLREYLPPQSPQ